MLDINRQKNRGDTIVEALLALAIAAFAVGIAYATANRSLNQAIQARERNEALSIIQNQITDLRIRFKGDTVANFNTNFGSKTDFCLDDTATVATPKTDPTWLIYQNTIDATHTFTTFPYVTSTANACQRNTTGEGATFYIDITTTTNPPATPDPNVNYTVFQVSVRWDRAGGGPANQASLFYRPNGNG